MENNKNYGVMLMNLGTPDAPTTKAVKQFLSQFLHDHRVVDTSRWIWCPVLHGIILPKRSPKVAKLYQSIWTEQGSPLMVYAKSQAKLLEKELDLSVELAMTYGNPSVDSAIKALNTRGVNELIVLPLYPQYSGTTTGAAEDALNKALSKAKVELPVTLVRDYHDHPLYIKALANKIRAHWCEHGQGDYLLCSYHGIPQRYADNGDVYPQHCQKTTQLLAQELGLNSQQIGMSYQSRFGKEPWVTPYTDVRLTELPLQSVKTLDIITPAFSCDCLETLEEIAHECKTIFVQAGGEAFRYIPCLNDDKEHINMMADIVKSALEK